MRAREFTMKDAYSFHLDQASLQQTYDLMYSTYQNIFNRLGFTFRAVLADSGNIGGSSSHEFHVLADSGEDLIVFSDEGSYAANLEMASALPPASLTPAAPVQTLEEVATPNAHTIEDVSALLQVEARQTVKTLIVMGEEQEGRQPLVALVLRGDHQLNEIKAAKLAGVQSPLTFAPDTLIKQELECMPGSLGPVGINVASMTSDHM
jgi:prolyl-tRNA synthetase